MNIEVIIKIDVAIRSGGSTIDAISRRAGVGNRMVFNYLKYMRTSLGAPIVYDRSSGVYQYAVAGEFKFYWENSE